MIDAIANKDYAQIQNLLDSEFNHDVFSDVIKSRNPTDGTPSR